MAAIEENERTAVAQMVTGQPDGPGKRIGKRGEAVVIGKVLPGGAKLFRERVAQFQAEAAYWETRVGTVQDFRLLLFDDDTRIMFIITYDGDFKPYIGDVINQAGPWFDGFFQDIWEGYDGATSQGTLELVLSQVITADVFFCAHPDVTVRDIAKMKRLTKAFGEVLDAAS